MGQSELMLNRLRTVLTDNEPDEEMFEVNVARAVDDFLSSLGESAKQAVYSHLKNAHAINKEDIPCKIEEFAYAIEETFGSVAKLMEIKIIENLHSQYADFRYAPKNGELDFVEYVTELQNDLEPKTDTVIIEP